MPQKNNTPSVGDGASGAEKKTRFRSTFYFQGKQYEAASSKSQKDADQKAAVKEEKLKRGEIGISSGMTVKRWALEWLETYKHHTVTDKSYKDYESQIENAIIPEVGSLRLSDVKAIHLQNVLNNYAGYSLTRVRRLRNTIRAIFTRARMNQLINHNPAEFLELPKAKDGTHRNITEVERKHFLNVAETHHAGLMFMVMLYCGLRTGEVVALS